MHYLLDNFFTLCLIIFVNWPIVLLLQIANTYPYFGRIVCCNICITMVIPYGKSVWNHFSRLFKSEITEDAVGLSMFAFMCGVVLSAINVLCTSRLLAVWFFHDHHYTNIPEVYMTVVSVICTVFLGNTTIVLLQRWLEYLDLKDKSRSIALVIWFVAAFGFVILGYFMVNELSSECPTSTRVYYIVGLSSIGALLVALLAQVCYYVIYGIKKQPFWFKAGFVFAYILLYCPFNIYWVVTGFQSQIDQACMNDQPSIYVAFFIIYLMTIAPLVLAFAISLIICFYKLITFKKKATVEEINSFHWEDDDRASLTTDRSYRKMLR